MVDQDDAELRIEPLQRVFISFLFGITGWYIWNHNQLLAALVITLALVVLLHYPLPFVSRENRSFVGFILLNAAVLMMGTFQANPIAFYGLMVCTATIILLYLTQIDWVAGFFVHQKLATLIIGVTLWLVASYMGSDLSVLGLGISAIVMWIGGALVAATIYMAARY